MARKPTISPTKIATYLACPVKYLWTYKDQRGRWYLRARSYYSFGTTLHRVLQRFHDEGDKGVETTQELVSSYEESWIESGYRSAEEMSEAFGEGLAILERHVADHSAASDQAKTLFVEKQLKIDFGDFVLLGRLDRIDEYEDGTIEVVDYKSGRSSVSEEEVAQDIAMGIYQLLLRHKFPGRPVRARILALRTGESATAAFSDAEAEEFTDSVCRVAREIIAEDFFERVPTPKALCSRCDFLPLCQKNPDYS